MKTIYQVVEYGDDWDSSWEAVVCTCSSFELAHKIAREIEENHTTELSEKEFNEIRKSMHDWILDDTDDNLKEYLAKLYPQYSEETLKKAIKVSDNLDENWSGVRVVKTDLFESEDEYFS